MSPEQALGDPIDHRTDIYSLGVVLYEMLAGRVPFQADSTLTVLHMHAHATPPPIPGLPAKVQAVIDCALQKNPADRYPTSGELANDFFRAIGINVEARVIQEPAPVSPVPVEPPVTVLPAHVSLPADLLDLLSHDNSSVRKLALQELIAFLDGKHLGLAHAAQEKLREIATTDDSLTVRRIAAEELSARGFEADSDVPVAVETPKETLPVAVEIPKETVPVAVEIPKEKAIEQPPSPVKDSPATEKTQQDLNPLPPLTRWRPALPKLERRFVGGIIGIALGIILLAWASPLIVKGITGPADTPTPTITPTPALALTAAPTLVPTLTQTSSPTSTPTLTATPSQTLTSTPTPTKTFLPTLTEKPTRKPRPTKIETNPA
jgi:hypothetical protein